MRTSLLFGLLALGCADRPLPLPDSTTTTAPPDLGSPADASRDAAPLIGDGAAVDLSARDAARCTPGFEVRSAGAQPMLQNRVVVGDFNGDGKLDFAAGDFGYGEWGAGFSVDEPGSINLYLGRGDGSFAAPTVIRQNLHVYGAVGGDFDEDGRMDLVAYEWSSQASDAAQLVLLRGQADGTLAATPLGSVPRSWPAAARIDDDAHLDLLLLGDQSQTVMLGNGDGTFTSKTFATSPGSGLYPTVFGDFDHDGHTDWAGAAGSELFVFRGAGDGSFSAASTVALPGSFSGGLNGVQSGDLDGDGIVDLMLATPGGVSWFRGAGDGSFGAATAIVDELDQPVAWDQLTSAVDLDGDGRLDLIGLVLDDLDSSELKAARQLADGRFSVQSLATHDGFLMNTADFNGDGRPDVLAVYPVSWQLFPGGDGGQLGEQPWQGTGQLANIALVDVDGDGRLDVVGADAEGPGIMVAHFDRDATPGLPATLLDVHYGSFCRGDFDGDGQPDVVAGSAHTEAWWLVRSRGTTALTLAGAAACLGTGDLDGDGHLDLLMARDSDGNGLWFRGNGDGTFAAPVDLGLPLPFNALLADFDGDGRADLIWSDPTAGAAPAPHLEIARGNGDGSFAAATGVAASDVPNYVGDTLAARDLDGDGRLDLIVLDGTRQEVEVVLQRSDGSAAAPAAYPLGDWARSLAVGDLDGDGRDDVMVSLAAGVGWLRGHGDGTLDSVAVIPTATNVSGDLQLGDVDGDGRLDVVVASRLTSQLTVVHNVCR